MSTNLKRITFVITPDLVRLLDKVKKEKFYNCSQSQMIRALVETGLNVIDSDEKDGVK